MKIEDLIKKFISWISEQDDNSVVKLRLDNKEKAREWVYKALEYDKELTLKEFQDFFDRDEQNQEYKTRYEERNISCYLCSIAGRF